MPRPNRTRSIQSEVNLADRIKFEREQRGWSLEGLAARMSSAGCSIQGSAIFKIENSDPPRRMPRRITVDELVALGTVFGEPIEELLLPVELVRKREAVKLLNSFDALWSDLQTSSESLFDWYTDFLRITSDDADLAQVFGRMAVAGEMATRDRTDRIHVAIQGLVSAIREAAATDHEAANATDFGARIKAMTDAANPQPKRPARKAKP